MPVEKFEMVDKNSLFAISDIGTSTMAKTLLSDLCSDVILPSDMYI